MRVIHIAVVVSAIGFFSGLCLGCSSSSGTSGGSCADAWNKAVAACPAVSSNQQSFLQQCNNPSEFPGCASQASAFADCIKSASSYTCDSLGQPHAVGCDSQANAVGLCVLAWDAGLTTD